MIQPNSNDTSVIPIFLFSLPRSGSTLTQRILATHPEIETASEPWILLPFLFSLRRDGVYATYGHKLSVDAIEDFCAGLPGGAATYRREIVRLALRLYSQRAKPGVRYFLDKTPRYHLVAEEIVELFPDARFVFLWRNPLAIIASIVESWGQGRWNVFKYEIDLFDGLSELIRVADKYRDRIHAVRYEDLVTGSPDVWHALFAYLGIEFEPSRLSSFGNVELSGRMGDVSGRKAYGELSAEPLDKWKRVLASPLRKMWCRRYLNQIGRQRLAIMGYDLDELLAALNEVPTRYRTVVGDALGIALGGLFRVFEPRIAVDKITRLLRRVRVYAHL